MKSNQHKKEMNQEREREKKFDNYCKKGRYEEEDFNGFILYIATNY